jgi:hypothetical protein
VSEGHLVGVGILKALSTYSFMKHGEGKKLTEGRLKNIFFLIQCARRKKKDCYWD